MAKTKEKSKAINFDPNFVYCGRMVTQKVRLTFGQWTKRATVEVEVGGNCRGASIVESAVLQAHDDLTEAFDAREEKGENEWRHPYLLLEDEEGGLVHEMEGEDDLGDLLIAFEIISYEPEKK